MNTKNYTMGSFEELFNDYSVVSLEEYFEILDRETMKRTKMVAKSLTKYLKANKKFEEYRGLKLA